MELQQSPPYLAYIRKLKWDVTEVDGVSVIHRHLFLIGGLAKLQRSATLPSSGHMKSFVRGHRIRTLAVEPASAFPQEKLTAFCRALKTDVKINSSPYLPTKTILIDLGKSGDEMFHSFTEAKRRAVRRAVKNNVVISESDDIDDMIRIKSKSAGLFGSITTYGLRHLRETFTPRNSAILLASLRKPDGTRRVIGGVFLLFWEKTAYYWLAGATREGKKLFAPTLLVWEALKLAKRHGAKKFDFVGVWDERLPRQNHDWLGFTKFKEGFGGISLYYPISLL